MSNWKRFADALNLQIDFITPNELGLDIPLDPIPVLRNYGAKNGMLLFPNGVIILKYNDILISKGFGFSVLDEPEDDFLVKLESYRAMLKDWGSN